MLKFKQNIKFDSKTHSYTVNNNKANVLGSVSKIKSEVFPAFIGVTEVNCVTKALIKRHEDYMVNSKVFKIDMSALLTTINSQCNKEVIEASNDLFFNIYENYKQLTPGSFTKYPHFLHYLIGQKGDFNDEKYDEIVTFLMNYNIYIDLNGEQVSEEDEGEEEMEVVEAEEKIKLPYTSWKEVNDELRQTGGGKEVFSINEKYKFNQNKLTHVNHKIVLIKKEIISAGEDFTITGQNTGEFIKTAKVLKSPEVYFINVKPSEFKILNEDDHHVGNNTYKYVLKVELDALAKQLINKRYYLIRRLGYENNLNQYGYREVIESRAHKITPHTREHLNLAIFIFWKYTAILGTIMHSEIETMVNESILANKDKDVISKDYFKTKRGVYKKNESGILLNRCLEMLPDGKFYGVEVKVAIPFGDKYITGTIDCIYQYYENNVTKYIIIDWKRTNDIMQQTVPTKDQLCFQPNAENGEYNFMYNGDSRYNWEGFGQTKEDQYKLQIGLYRELFISCVTQPITVDFVMLMTIRPRGTERTILFQYNINEITNINRKIEALKSYILLTADDRKTIFNNKLIQENIIKVKKEEVKELKKAPVKPMFF
jgi:hypothetical protein